MFVFPFLWRTDSSLLPPPSPEGAAATTVHYFPSVFLRKFALADVVLGLHFHLLLSFFYLHYLVVNLLLHYWHWSNFIFHLHYSAPGKPLSLILELGPFSLSDSLYGKPWSLLLVLG
jgi:hypothetical protein